METEEESGRSVLCSVSLEKQQRFNILLFPGQHVCLCDAEGGVCRNQVCSCFILKLTVGVVLLYL